MLVKPCEAARALLERKKCVTELELYVLLSKVYIAMIINKHCIKEA